MVLIKGREEMSWPVAAMMCFIAVCYFLVMQGYSPLGDDLSTMARWDEACDKGGVLAWPFYAARHYLSVNGRMGDKLAPLLFCGLPRVVANALLGVSFGLLLAVTVRSCGFRGRAFGGKTLLLALCVFTLPFWDSMLLYVCWMNYIVALLFTLLYIRYLKGEHPLWSDCLMAVFGFVAGAMHEACTLPAALGMMAWLGSCKSARGGHRKLLVATYFLGAVFIMFSPPFRTRVADAGNIVNGRDWWYVLFTSDFYALLLSVVALCLLACRCGRLLLGRAVRTDWILFAVAAVASAAVSVKSGIVGRTGIFSQVFALIAIFRLASMAQIKISRAVAGIGGSVLMAAMAVHFGAFVFFQREAGRELSQVISGYASSADGTVYCDYMRDEELPWWLLRKVRTVPDADDVWLLTSIARAYGDEVRLPVVLPECLSIGEMPRGFMKCGKDYVTPVCPAYEIEDTYERLPVKVLRGTPEMVVQEFRRDGRDYYLLSRRDRDLGD